MFNNLISSLLSWLESLATSINPEIFVIAGAFLEEIIAPIPSPFVMTTIAAIAKAQSFDLLKISWLIILASAAKTASGYLIYLIVDRAEDLVVGKYGKYFGVNHENLEKIGSMLNNSWWDDILLLLSRAIPIIPTSLVTVAAGVIKYNVVSFLTMTFIGTIIRNIFYLFVGYYGWEYIDNIKDKFISNPTTLIVIGIISIIIIIVLMKIKDILWEKMLNSKKTKKEE
jgi:membrane protein DedA with SNARE-associated domain